MEDRLACPSGSCGSCVFIEDICHVLCVVGAALGGKESTCTHGSVPCRGMGGGSPDGVSGGLAEGERIVWPCSCILHVLGVQTFILNPSHLTPYNAGLWGYSTSTIRLKSNGLDMRLSLDTMMWYQFVTIKIGINKLLYSVLTPFLKEVIL